MQLIALKKKAIWEIEHGNATICEAM